MIYSHEQFFVLTVKDLQEKLSRGTEYDLIRACGLCRHLLIDVGTPLWYSANRNYKLKLTFEVADYEDFHSGSLRFPTAWMTVMPNHITNKTRVVSKSEFLKIILINNNEFRYTVKDIIRAGAHYLGGIHTGAPEDSNQRSLSDFHARTNSHTKILFFAAKAICTVIIAAMQPLLVAIENAEIAKD